MSALLLVAVFVVLLILGVPIAFAVGSAAAVSLLTSIDTLPALATVAQRIATGLDSFSLLAIPLFILSGQLMNRGGAARRLIDLGRALVGPLPGGTEWVVRWSPVSGAIRSMFPVSAMQANRAPAASENASPETAAPSFARGVARESSVRKMVTDPESRAHTKA